MSYRGFPSPGKSQAPPITVSLDPMGGIAGGWLPLVVPRGIVTPHGGVGSPARKLHELY